MKKFKGVILALAIVMGIGMVKPAEAYADTFPTRTGDYYVSAYQPDGSINLLDPSTLVVVDYIDSARKVYISNPVTRVSLGTVYAQHLLTNAYAGASVNLRDKASVDTGEIITTIPSNGRMVVDNNHYGYQGRWRRVHYQGLVGYVSASYLIYIKR